MDADEHIKNNHDMYNVLQALRKGMSMTRLVSQRWQLKPSATVKPVLIALVIHATQRGIDSLPTAALCVRANGDESQAIGAIVWLKRNGVTRIAKANLHLGTYRLLPEAFSPCERMGEVA